MSIKKWLTDLFRDKILRSETDRPLYELESLTIRKGDTDEERLDFWMSLEAMFDTPAGKAYQALMQREFGKLQGQLLASSTPELTAEIVSKMKQQDFVIRYPQVVAALVKKKQEKLAR